jgi:hypothetical protein
MSEQNLILYVYKDDALLATLSNIQLFDWPWYKCSFQPTPAFEPYKALFDRELELLEGNGADEEWFSIYSEIENLSLRLFYPEQPKSTALFFLHVDGKTARFKADFQ